MAPNDLDITVRQTPAKLTKIGLAITAGWMVVLVVYVAEMWGALLAMKPDAFATFLGGAFAPMAFLWLILGYLQQGEELRHSVEALRLQSEELKNSVEQQRELVAATREQLDHERQMVERDRQSSSPLFRLEPHGTRSNGVMITQEFLIMNVGNRCTNATVTIAPDGFKRIYPAFDSGQVERADLSFGKTEEIPEQKIRITYRNVHGLSENTEFKLVPSKDAAGANVYKEEVFRIIEQGNRRGTVAEPI